MYSHINDKKELSRCLACPPGLSCPGGYSNLVVDSNFWRNSPATALGNSQFFVAFACDINKTDHDNSSTEQSTLCVGTDHCSYGLEQKTSDKFICTPDTTCLQGYFGPLCLGCDNDNGYFSTFIG